MHFVAKRCIEDGADVIINGCAYSGPALTLAGYHEVTGTGVSVVDCAGAALKLAELLADLSRATGLTKSRGGSSPYVTPPRETLDRVRRDFGF